MANNDRAMPPRAGSYVGSALMIGLLISFGVGWLWCHYAITLQQRTLLSVYAQASIPYPKTMDVNKYFAKVHHAPVPRNRSRIDKGPLRVSLRYMVYEGKSFTRFFQTIVIVFGSIIVVSLIVGTVLYRKAIRRARSWNRLRGSRFKTIAELNKSVKGPYMSIRVREVPDAF